MPSYYQHPTKTTIQTRSPTALKKPQSSPLEIPNILTETLLHLPHSDLLTSAVLVCKEWKEVIDGQSFDIKLFRLRSSRSADTGSDTATGAGLGSTNPHLQESVDSTLLQSYTLHPLFQKFKYYSAHPGIGTTRYHGNNHALQTQTQTQPHRKDSFVWPPVKKIYIGFHHPATARLLIVKKQVENEEGVTLGDVIDHWERGIRQSVLHPRLCPACNNLHIQHHHDINKYAWVCNEWELAVGSTPEIGREGVLVLRGWEAVEAEVGVGVGVAVDATEEGRVGELAGG